MTSLPWCTLKKKLKKFTQETQEKWIAFKKSWQSAPSNPPEAVLTPFDATLAPQQPSFLMDYYHQYGTSSRLFFEEIEATPVPSLTWRQTFELVKHHWQAYWAKPFCSPEERTRASYCYNHQSELNPSVGPRGIRILRPLHIHDLYAQKHQDSAETLQFVMDDVD